MIRTPEEPLQLLTDFDCPKHHTKVSPQNLLGSRVLQPPQSQ